MLCMFVQHSDDSKISPQCQLVQCLFPQAQLRTSCRAVMMDVRLAQKYFANACPDSQSFPLYQPISGWGPAATIRRAGFTFFGVYGTERNMEWLQQVEDAVPKGAFAPLLCSACKTLLSDKFCARASVACENVPKRHFTSTVASLMYCSASDKSADLLLARYIQSGHSRHDASPVCRQRDYCRVRSWWKLEAN